MYAVKAAAQRLFGRDIKTVTQLLRPSGNHGGSSLEEAQERIDFVTVAPPDRVLFTGEVKTPPVIKALSDYLSTHGSGVAINLTDQSSPAKKIFHKVCCIYPSRVIHRTHKSIRPYFTCAFGGAGS